MQICIDALATGNERVTAELSSSALPVTTAAELRGTSGDSREPRADHRRHAVNIRVTATVAHRTETL
jgi:hypothetical protein